MVMGMGSVSGQRIYADNESHSASGSSLVGEWSVTNPTKALLANLTTTDFAKLHTFAVANLGGIISWEQVKFNVTTTVSSLPAYTTVYLKVDGFSGSLLGLLGGGSIKSVAYQGSTSTADGSSIADANTTVTSFTASDGSVYISVKPNLAYNSIRLSITPAVLLSNADINLYHAFYIPPPTINNVTTCSGTQASITVSNPNASMTYNWYTAATGGDLVNTGTTYSPSLTSNTTYYVEASDGGQFFSARTPVTVTVNPLPSISTTQTATTVPTGSSITFNATSSASTIKWYDSSGALKFTGANPTFGPFATPGTYSYEVIADNGTCINSTTVTFSVYSTTTCPTLSKRVYANSTTWSSIITGYVTDDALAADGDPKTSSTLTSLVGLLGIGTVTQNLFWNNTVAAGTPATIKLGLGTGVLSLIPNVSVVGIKKNGTVTTEIGTAQIVNASLLKLLPGDNTLEFTITPSDKTGPVAYDGIRVVLGSLVSVAQSARVFDAYYYTPTPAVDCTKGDVTDIVYGVKDIGVGALSVTVGVQNAWNSVDGDMNTYATMLSGAGVLAQAREQIIFSSPSLPGDSLRIITSTGASLLGVNLLTGFSIQRYLGGVPVGTPIDNTSTLLSIKLLSGNTRAAIVLSPTPEPYDRVEILYGGVANVLTSINIHEVQRVATTKFASSDLNNAITACKGEVIPLPAPTDNCTTFELYDVPTGGTPISPSVINTALFDGTKTFYIQPVRFGCRLMTRGPVTVTVNPLPTVSAIIGNANICVGVGYTFTNTSADPGVWTSSNPAVATVDNTGFVKGINVGTASIIYTITSGTTNCSNSTSFAVNVAALPTIALGSIPAICSSTTTASLPYTSTSSGTLKYSIVWDTPGFTNVSDIDLPASPVVLAIPANAPVGNNTGTFTIKNITSGCTSSSRITVPINPLPAATINGSTTICEGATSPLITFTGSNGTSPYTFTYNINSGTTNTITTTSGNSVTLSVPTTTAGTYTYTLTKVQDNSSSSCSQNVNGQTAVIVIKPLPILTGNLNPAVCSEETFSYTAMPNLTPTSISWTRATVSGISNPPGSGNSASINENLINTGTTAVDVTYIFTIVANGCSNTSTLVVKVNPRPGKAQIASQ